MPPESTPAVVPGFEQLYEYRARLLDRLEQQPAEFAAVVAAIPALEWHRRQDDLGRSVHMLAAHVRFLETLAFYPRIRSILDEDYPDLTAYPTHHWAEDGSLRVDTETCSAQSGHPTSRRAVIALTPRAGMRGAAGLAAPRR